MGEKDKKPPVSLQELMVSTLAMMDAAVKLLIEKGVFSEAEFKEKPAGGTGDISADSRAARKRRLFGLGFE
jgi:hypothetical protein